MASSGNVPMDVGSLIRNFDRAGRRTSTTGVSRGASPAPHHGIAERGRSYRHRSRDRDRGISEPIITRIHPSGPQEQMDWLDALEALSDRFEAVERTQRMHAHTIAQMHEASIGHRKLTTETTGDIAAYKAYVGKTFETIDSYVKNRHNEVCRVINTTINDNLNMLNDRLCALDGNFQTLLAHVNTTGITAQRFDIGSAQPDTSHDDPRGTDPWQMGRSQMNLPRRDLPPPSLPTATVAPEIPASFAQPNTTTAPDGPGFLSPFDDDLYSTPPTRPRFAEQPWTGHQPNAGHHGGGHPSADVQSQGFEISYKPNEAMRKFDGDSSKYKLWNDRTLDHLARSNTYWKTLLKKLQICTYPISKQWLEGQWIYGANGWALSEKLETFICTWVSDALYGRRTQLAGGPSQSGNGFEIWRQLYQEHHGGAEAVQLGGMRRLQEWPKCTSIGNLTQHLDAWVECLETHNTELLAAPNVLRSMLLGIIPTEYEDEILVRPEITTYAEIIEYCKRRTTYKRQKALSELTRRPTNGPRVNALDGTSKHVDDDQIPSWAMKLFGSMVPPPQPFQQAPVGGKSEVPDVAALQRPQTPNGRRAFNLKFRFNGCWHCGEQGHSRKANAEKNIKGCPKFEALKSRNQGKPPENYKGAYEKARDIAWEKFRAKQPSVNHLADTEDDDDSDFDDVDESYIGMFALTAVGTPSQKSFVDPNPFAELSEDDEEMDEDVIAHFSQWAHKVNSASANLQSVKLKPKQKKSIQISSLKELDEQMASNPKLAALPSNPKKLSRALRKMPTGIEIKEGEVLALVDTGSNIHAADVDLHFNSYAHTVRTSPSQRRGHPATTAGGHQLDNLGKFTVSAIADGQEIRIAFNHMKVKLPILSVRQMMGKGSRMSLTEEGGTISNDRTNQSINFIVHDDLWYVKLKVQPPPSANKPTPNMPFGRQGSP